MSGAPHAAEITRTATVAALPDLLGALDDAVAQADVGDEVRFALRLAVEEACANVIEHGYADGAPGPITLRVVADDHAVSVILTDRAPLFDPSHAPAPDLDADVMERPVGGLGWHLICETMDEVRHAPAPGGGNRLTLVKHRTPAPLG